MKYWIEAISSSLDEAGIKVTNGQLENIARDMKSAEETHSFYAGNEIIDKVRIQDNGLSSLKKQLTEEVNKTPCKNCNGTGWVHYGYCRKCNGTGRN